MLSAFSHAAQTVNVSGAVQRPGDLAWQPGARLLNASIGAAVADDAWYQGAALLRKSAMRDQRKLKRGILFDLLTHVPLPALKQWRCWPAGSSVYKICR